MTSIRWWAASFVMVIAASALARADVVDRIVAVVGGQPITWSDVRAARALGLVVADAATPVDAIVDRLIVRELMRSEVDRFSVAPGDGAEVDAAVRRARERLAGRAGTSDLLDTVGMTEARLRAWIEDDQRIERYLQQRFDAAAQPTDEEVVLFFQSREREFQRDGRLQPLAAVRDAVRARLIAQRRQQLIDEWVASLRRRTAVVLLPTP